MRRFPRKSPDPWLRSVEESRSPERGRDQRLTLVEILVVVAVIAAIIAMAIWFIFFSHGGIGPGTV